MAEDRIESARLLEKMYGWKEMGMFMKVAILMPSFNRPNLVQKAIDSILAQTFTDWRLYILDNSSPQLRKQIRKVLKEYAIKDQRIKIFHEDELIHQGEAYNRLMFEYSQKDEGYTMFYADDCRMDPLKLGLLVTYLNQHPNHNIVCGIMSIERKNKSPIILGNWDRKECAVDWMNLVQPLIRRSLIDRVGPMKKVKMVLEAPDANYWKQISKFCEVYGAKSLKNIMVLDNELERTYMQQTKNKRLWEGGWNRGELYE